MKQFQFKIAQITLVLLFSILTLIQFLSIPGQFAYMRETQGLSLLFEILLTAVVGFLILCGQIAIFCLWKILQTMRKNQFFSNLILSWISRLLNSLKSASITTLVLFTLIGAVADDPGILVVLTGFSLFIFSLTLIVSLLRDQIQLKVS